MRNSYIFLNENAFENVCEMSAIVSRPQYVNGLVQNRWQFITWTNDDTVHWCNMSQCVYKLIHELNRLFLADAQFKYIFFKSKCFLNGDENFREYGLFHVSYYRWVIIGLAGLILGLCPANERRCYFVTTSLSHWLGANLESVLFR